METLVNAPPPSKLMSDRALVELISFVKSSLNVTPGIVIAAPRRKINKIIIVKKIRLMISLFLKTERNVFMLDYLNCAFSFFDASNGGFGELMSDDSKCDFKFTIT